MIKIPPMCRLLIHQEFVINSLKKLFYIFGYNNSHNLRDFLSVHLRVGSLVHGYPRVHGFDLLQELDGERVIYSPLQPSIISTRVCYVVAPESILGKEGLV